MKKITVIALGIIIAFTSMWIGAYWQGQIPREHWASFPALATAVFCG